MAGENLSMRTKCLGEKILGLFHKIHVRFWELFQQRCIMMQAYENSLHISIL